MITQKRFKTIQARARQVIRKRIPNRKPVLICIKGFSKKERYRILGSRGFPLTDSSLKWLRREKAETLVLSYLDKNFECFANAFTIEVKLEELL